MLYDFEGDVPSGELVVYTDEILTVSRTVRGAICKKLIVQYFICIGLLLFVFVFVCDSFWFVFGRMSVMDGGKGLAPTDAGDCFLKLTLR